MDGEIQSISDGIVEGNPGSRERVAILKPKPEDHDDKVESWEEELEEHAEGLKDHIWDWADLQADIKKQLKKESKTLPLSRLNQLMIISCFATLHLKGFSHTQSSIEVLW